jgi:uncharacterized protein
MSLLQEIESQLVAALKSRDRLAANTLRALKTRIQNERIAKMHELSDQETLALVRSEVKKRKEAAESFANAGRTEQADIELQESHLLQTFLPPQLSADEIRAVIEKVLNSLPEADRNLGKVMQAVKAQVGDSADGATVAAHVRNLLSQ